MKKGFPTKPLQSLCDDFKQDIVDGPFGSELKREDYIPEGIPVLKIQNVKPFAIELKKMDYVSAEKFHELRRHSFRRGDIVMTKLGSPLGVSAIVEDVEEGVIVADLVRVRAQQINTKYLCYHLNSQRTNDFINSMQKGTTRPRVTLSVVRELPIYAPPLAEQQRIVGLLDEAFEGLATAKANAEKNLQTARALFESHLQSVFTQRGPGWVEKPLGDLCDFLNGFAFKSGDVVAESQTQLVRMGNLYGNQLDLDRNPVFYPDSFATEHSRYVLEEGDIIMSLTGTTGKEDYGFAVRIPDCGHTLLMNQRIMKFDAMRRDIIDDGYLLHYLRSRCFLDILYPTANGTRQANLSSVTMKLLPVPLRSLKEQKAIATKLDDLREETQRLARLYERKHAALEALKKSLLHQAFTGEL